MKVKESRVFGRRRREQDVEARGALMQAVARVERSLEEQAQAQAVTDVTVQDMYSTVVQTRNDLIKTVEYLYSVCSRLIERTESEQLERQALIHTMRELIERTESEQLERQALIHTMRELARPSTIELDPSRERVLGGSFPASDVDVDVGVEIEHHRPTGSGRRNNSRNRVAE